MITRPAALALAASLLLLGAAGSAWAEKADREKPINIESDRMTADDTKQTAVFEGKVLLTQGTTQLRADRLTVRQDKEGNSFSVAIGKPATFRTKRDGVDEWVDGEAERIEYDSKAERVELFVKGRLTREKDEVRGNYISYESRTEFFLVQDAKDAKPAAPGRPPERVRMVIQPKPRPPGPPTAGSGSGAGSATSGTPAAALQLQPSQTLANPR